MFNNTSKPLRVLGIDPGSQITGLGVIDAKGNELAHVFSESLKLPKSELSQRLAKIYSRVTEVVEQYQPDMIALEKVFIAKNPQSALVLGHARGAAMVAAVNSGISTIEYSATEIKKTVVGRGRADKAQVQHMMRVLLNLRVAPDVDASDALACAVCHVHQQQMQAVLNKQII